MLIVGAYILSNESEVNDQGSTRWWQAVHARTGQKVRIRKIPKEEFHQDTDMKQILPRYALCFKEKLVSISLVAMPQLFLDLKHLST